MLKVGATVPNEEFEIYLNDEFTKTSFEEYRGKFLVLLFYPADFTFICPTELTAAAMLYDAFKKESAEIISFSTDTVFSHKAWHDGSPAIGKVTYPMGADPTGKLCRLFGTMIEDDGLSLRGTFIIDPDGKLICADIHDNSIGRNADEILRRVRAAKFVREHGGEVCPANWQPGGDTLKPGVNLVGKI